MSTPNTVTQHRTTTPSGRPKWVISGVAGPVIFVVSTLLVLWLTFGEILAREATAGVIIAWMLLLLALRIPVGVAMALAGGVGIFSMMGARSFGSLVGEIPFSSTAT